MVRQYLGTPSGVREHGVMGAPKWGRHKSSPQRVSSLGVGRWKQLEPEEN